MVANGGPFTPGIPPPMSPEPSQLRASYQGRGPGAPRSSQSVTLLYGQESPDGAGNGMQREGNGRPPTPPPSTVKDASSGEFETTPPPPSHESVESTVPVPVPPATEPPAEPPVQAPAHEANRDQPGAAAAERADKPEEVAPAERHPEGTSPAAPSSPVSIYDNGMYWQFPGYII